MPTYVVRNITRNTIVAESATKACTFWARAKGLLGRRSLPVGGGLVITPCNSVHMWGMRFAIDVLYVSSENVVVACVPNLQPWSFGPLLRRANWVLELPAGAIADSGSMVGDQLEIVAGL